MPANGQSSNGTDSKTQLQTAGDKREDDVVKIWRRMPTGVPLTTAAVAATDDRIAEVLGSADTRQSFFRFCLLDKFVQHFSSVG